MRQEGRTHKTIRPPRPGSGSGPSARRRAIHASEAAPGDEPDTTAIGAALLLANAAELDNALHLEWLISRFLPCWDEAPAGINVDYVEETCQAIVADLEDEADATALVVLRGLHAVGSGTFALESENAAGRLTGRGVTEPAWATQIGQAKPVAARVMGNDEDESKGVLVEYAYPDGERHVISAFIAADLGGAVKFLALTKPLAEFPDDSALEPLPADEAQALLRDALAVTDQVHARLEGDPTLLELGPLLWSRVRE
jgi:hypothetical protein